MSIFAGIRDGIEIIALELNYNTDWNTQQYNFNQIEYFMSKCSTKVDYKRIDYIGKNCMK